MNQDFAKDIFLNDKNKIFLSPLKYVQSWRHGRNTKNLADKKFWVGLVNRLLEKNFVPVIWQNDNTFDLSGEFLEKCLYLNDKNISKILAAMRASTLVLDVFNSLSRLAIAARTPFLAVDERSRWIGLNEQEFDDLCFKYLPKEYIFTFSTIVSEGGMNSWIDLYDGISVKLNKLISSIDRNKLPSTGEYEEVVSYSIVRQNRNKKLGTRLLKLKED